MPFLQTIQTQANQKAWEWLPWRKVLSERAAAWHKQQGHAEKCHGKDELRSAYFQMTGLACSGPIITISLCVLSTLWAGGSLSHTTPNHSSGLTEKDGSYQLCKATVSLHLQEPGCHMTVLKLPREESKLTRFTRGGTARVSLPIAMLAYSYVSKAASSSRAMLCKLHLRLTRFRGEEVHCELSEKTLTFASLCATFIQIPGCLIHNKLTTRCGNGWIQWFPHSPQDAYLAFLETSLLRLARSTWRIKRGSYRTIATLVCATRTTKTAMVKSYTRFCRSMTWLPSIPFTLQALPILAWLLVTCRVWTTYASPQACEPVFGSAVFGAIQATIYNWWLLLARETIVPFKWWLIMASIFRALMCSKPLNGIQINSCGESSVTTKGPSSSKKWKLDAVRCRTRTRGKMHSFKALLILLGACSVMLSHRWPKNILFSAPWFCARGRVIQPLPYSINTTANCTCKVSQYRADSGARVQIEKLLHFMPSPICCAGGRHWLGTGRHNVLPKNTRRETKGNRYSSEYGRCKLLGTLLISGLSGKQQGYFPDEASAQRSAGLIDPAAAGQRWSSGHNTCLRWAHKEGAKLVQLYGSNM